MARLADLTRRRESLRNSGGLDNKCWCGINIIARFEPKRRGTPSIVQLPQSPLYERLMRHRMGHTGDSKPVLSQLQTGRHIRGRNQTRLNVLGAKMLFELAIGGGAARMA